MKGISGYSLDSLSLFPRYSFRSEATSGRVILVFDKRNEKIAEVDGHIYWKNCRSSSGLVRAMGLSWLWDKHHSNSYNPSWKLLWVWVVGTVATSHLHPPHNLQDVLCQKIFQVCPLGSIVGMQ